MHDILIVLCIILIFYFIFRGECFSSGYNVVRLWGDSPWATYSAADGSFLNHTFRHDIQQIEYDFSYGPAYMELWGYRGAGDPRSENFGNLYNNANWDTVMMYDNGRGYVNLDTYEPPKAINIPTKGFVTPKHKYHAYRIVLVF